MSLRITYTTPHTAAELEAMNTAFDAAVTHHRSRLGIHYPPQDANQRTLHAHHAFPSVNPANLDETLHWFDEFPLDQLDTIMDQARAAQNHWGALPWQRRVEYLRRVATGIRDRLMPLASAVALESGKNRFESLGDVAEAADLIDYYADELSAADGYYRPLGSLLPGEQTGSWMRPYGVFVVISPFNFPVALAVGMSSAALLGGNTVVFKPSEETPWCGQLIAEVMHASGLPEGVFQICHGRGEVVGRALVNHPVTAGVAFTGSVTTGREIHRACTSGRWHKPCLMELGGKNGAIIMPSANLDEAALGCVKSVFGLSGQKCSALSRIIVHHDIKADFLHKLCHVAQNWLVSEPTRRTSNLGPVINAAAVQRAERAHALATTNGGSIIYHHSNVDSSLPKGHYVMPVFAELPVTHELMLQELFVPFAGIATVHSLDEAIATLNHSDFGLTAGCFSQDEHDIQRFLHEAEAGVLYVNRPTGATTGAWPGVQSFCGWKASGSSGKGGCGPWYVSQFMREQSHTRMLPV